MGFSDWTYESVTAAPTTIEINYVNAQGQPASVSLTSTTFSETRTTYNNIYYTTPEGRSDYESVATTRSSMTRTTAAAVNGAYVTWRLSNAQGLPSGDALRQSETIYAYSVGPNGPYVSREDTKEYISGYEFAGSLNISDYTGFEPTSSLFLSGRTITEYEESIGGDGRQYTKTVTTRYLSMGLTQEGQQSAAEQLAQDAGDGVITAQVFNAMKELVCDGAEVRNSIGRAPTPARPSYGQLVSDYINDGFTGDGNDGASSTWTIGGSTATLVDSGQRVVEIIFRYTPGSETTVSRIDSYSLPYSPDSTYTGSFSFPAGSEVTWNDVRSLFSGAANAAKNYGLMMNALTAGYAYGFNITTSCDRLPTKPFAPLYINAAGLSVATRLNGTSWAFDGSGMVASSDLMLCGVAGRIGAVSSSWVRVPVGVENLPLLSPPTEGATPAPGSTITAPDGFDPTNPGDVFSDLPADNNDVPGASQDPGQVVPPFLTDEALEGRSRHLLVVTELPYAAVPTPEDVVITSRHRGTADVGLLLALPAVEALITPQPPALSTGAVAAVPVIVVNPAVAAPSLSTGAVVPAGAVGITITALAPELRSGVGLAVPTVEATITALVLDTVGPEGPRLEIPTVEAAITAEGPAVASGVGLAVPAVAIDATAPVPVAVSGVALAVPTVEATITAEVPSVVITVPPLFKAVTYTGNGGTLSVTGLGFKPGIVWVKARNAFTAHTLFDAARGPTKYWQPSGDAAEITDATTLTSFDSDGFTVGASSLVNTNGTEYIAWCWRDPGTAATNTQGTITSTVAASPAQGISLISYAGAASAGTVGHGLAAAPDFVMIKNNTVQVNAVVGSPLMPQYALLTMGRIWSETVSSIYQGFSASTISLGSQQNVNVSSNTFTGYAFKSVPGASKIGTFAGAGAADQSIDCEFAPKYVLIRAYSSQGDWLIYDSARGVTNQLAATVFPETTENKVTFGASGFTVKASTNVNASGVSYIYMAFA